MSLNCRVCGSAHDPANECREAVHHCIGNDPACPCQDGDVCHYVATPTTRAMPARVPVEEQLRASLVDMRSTVAIALIEGMTPISGRAILWAAANYLYANQFGSHARIQAMDLLDDIRRGYSLKAEGSAQ